MSSGNIKGYPGPLILHHKTIKNKTVMKKHFKLLGAAVIIGVALGSCETDEPIDESEFGDLKIAYNGLIKPTDNSIVLKWNEAVSKVVDNKMPPPPEARIYAMVMLAMHDALNQVIPYYETYALDNSGVNTKGITRKVIQGLANAAACMADGRPRACPPVAANAVAPHAARRSRPRPSPAPRCPQPFARRPDRAAGDAHTP